MAKNAIKVVDPAKLDNEASITFNNRDDLQITRESVRATPDYTNESEEDEFFEDYEAIDIQIRATDLDSAKQGWAGVIPSLHKKRIRLLLDSAIDPEHLRDKRTVTANVTIVFGYDKEFNKYPKKVFIRKLLEDSDTTTAL